MSLFDDITAGLDAVFGRGTKVSNGIQAWTLKKPAHRNPKFECDGCMKVRVLGTWDHGGDTMHWCYNCSNSMFGHTYNSSRLSRREFYGRIYMG
jgi:hypothetical protein